MLPIDILFIIYCIYLPPLILLYLAEIWIIVKKDSPFRGSFYYLFVAGSIVDILMVGVTFNEFRLNLFPMVNGLFDRCNVCTQMRVAISYMCPFTQDLLNIFIAINRITSICRPMDYDSVTNLLRQPAEKSIQIWRKLLPISIAISYLLSIAIYAVAFTRKVSYTTVNLGNYAVYFTSEDFNYLPWYNTHYITAIEMIITSIIIAILYAVAAVNLRKVVNSSATIQHEKTLLKIGIINFIILLPAMVIQLIFSFDFFSIEWVIIMLYQYGWIIDLKCFCASVTMIVVNTSFRKHMIVSFGIRRQSNI